MGRVEQRNKKQNKQKTKKALHVQEQQNLSLSLSSGVTPPASSPGVGM
jgi:uncharacterized protein YggL (DUF469 family)